ncbi:cytochrome P450 71B37-like [Cornus florida]|uniref:cytochrome P450 71B37-like n=1 Tax=Cornus florida TaxID=4283 RepID=UPI00289DC61F|nr:cytochrome P450 71B37-like [Cornus florida]
MALYTTLLWLSLLLFLPLIVMLLMKMKIVKRQNKQLPPGPPKLPIIGNLHQIGTLAHRSLWQLSKKYGPVMFLKLGSIPTLVVSSAEAAREVLKIHDLDCCSRPQLAGIRKLSYNYIDIAFAPYGDYWRVMRKVSVLELFSTKRVQSFHFIREEEVSLMVNSIAQLSSSTTAVDLGENMLSLTANITCRVAFGKSFRGSGFDSDRFKEMIYEAMTMLACHFSSDFFPSVGWIIDRLTGLHGRLERIFHELDAFYQEVIDDHLNPGHVKQDQEDIIDILLRMERDEAELDAFHFTKDHIKAILMNIFLAGVDTGAITMEWAMAELVRNPKLMHKAQDEVRNCVGKKGYVSESDLDQLHFLKMVVKETLRLHPPAPLLVPRETMSNNFKLNGYDIYPKTLVHVNVWAIGRDPNIWNEPEEFFPERFIDSSVDFKGQHFEFLPFGAGRRGCPGMQMGTSMLEIAVANLLYHFNWELPNGMNVEDMNMEESPGQTIHRKCPLKLVPIIHKWPTED